MHPQSTSAPKRSPRNERRANARSLSTIARSMAEADPVAQAIREPYGYVRVSTILQRLKGYSLPKQLKAVAAAAVADENPIAPENLLGDADSGRKFERKGLQTLLTRAREGRVSVVYFAKVDRIGRNARDSLNIVHELKELGVRMVVLDPRLDTDDPFGYFLFVILAAMAELEATFILERTMGGKLEKLIQDEENGRPAPPPGRYTPFGLRYVPPARKGLPGTWEREPEQARWVLWIFAQSAKGMTCEAIAAALNQRHVPGPRGEYWYPVTVRRIIRSTTYIGDMVRKMGEQSFTFKVEPLVPPELWKAANATVDQNKHRSRRNSKHEYLLASSRAMPLLRCRVCHREGREYYMGGRTRTDRPNRGKRGEYYECSHYVAGKYVRHTVAAQRLEDAVWEALCAMLRDPDRVLARIERLADQANAEAREVAERVAALDEAETENRLAQSQLIELAMRRRLASDLIERQEEELAAEAERITRERAVLTAQLEQVQSGQAPIRQVRDACALLADGALEADFSDRKWLIGLLVDTIYADKEGWEMKGYLPGMEAAGTFDAASIAEHTS